MVKSGQTSPGPPAVVEFQLYSWAVGQCTGRGQLIGEDTGSSTKGLSLLAKTRPKNRISFISVSPCCANGACASQVSEKSCQASCAEEGSKCTAPIKSAEEATNNVTDLTEETKQDGRLLEQREEEGGGGGG